ncbi:MAG: endonuclease MutS2 [Oscillospiraceae bacterium]|nr:endonuclease MutS2 [Oscillospiraceae bacterium]
MKELLEKSSRTLELPKVLALLAEQAVTEEGKQTALALRPMTEKSAVAHALDETTAAAGMLVLRGSPAFQGVRPVRAALQRADMGGSLNTRELLDIAAVLRAARAAREYATGERGEKTCIDPLFAAMHPNRFLEDKITTSIVGEDELSDAASTELATIRRHIRAQSAKVRELLQKLISSNQAKYLQEAIITIRAGRYVVPVKAEYKHEIPGLVHDVSASGSTLFIEPMPVTKVNNELRELEKREEHEIARILAELSADCAQFREDIAANYDLLIQLDVIFAKAQLSHRMRACPPTLCERGLFFQKARHPLIPSAQAVANDLMLGEAFDTLVITGPNTGGKTVTLKTIGLLCLMAQCGLHIPAGGESRMAVFSQVLADVGDEQSIEQSLSTFSSHMTNIVGILAQAGEGALVLLDELCAGTDPVEGAALAAAIMERARAQGALVVATTHYAELKIYAMSTPGVQNASCEFNVETLSPTYRLLIGIPGKSNAFAISERLGLPGEIVQRAAARMDAEHVQFEDVLTRLEQQRQAMERETEAAALLRQETERGVQEARRYRETLEAERAKILDGARAEAGELLRDARSEADAVLKELSRMRKQQSKQSSWQEENDRRAGLRRRLNEAEAKLQADAPLTEAEQSRPAEVGDTVELLRMGTRATVIATGKDGSLQLQAGILKINARRAEVRVVEETSATQKQVQQMAHRAEQQLRRLGASPEIDLRGMMTDEAVAALDMFLDNAMLARLNQVVVIHGKGTGAVRKAVREHLKRSRYVKAFRPGQYGEGEDGVTVVELK